MPAATFAYSVFFLLGGGDFPVVRTQEGQGSGLGRGKRKRELAFVTEAEEQCQARPCSTNTSPNWDQNPGCFGPQQLERKNVLRGYWSLSWNPREESVGALNMWSSHVHSVLTVWFCACCPRVITNSNPSHTPECLGGVSGIRTISPRPALLPHSLTLSRPFSLTGSFMPPLVPSVFFPEK